MDIPDAEYEKRRHAFDLCRWINAQFRQMEGTGNLSAIYAEQKGKNVKRLIEEAVPLSRLALRFSRPGDEVFVTLPPESEGFDAHVEIEGFSPRSFKVEVTTTETDETVMQRQALARDGYAYFTGPVRREGRRIIFPEIPEFVDVREEEERLADLLFDRVKAKIESGRYGSDTAILAYLTQRLPLSFCVRRDLAWKTRDYLFEVENKPYDIFYCCWAGLVVDAASDVTGSRDWAPPPPFMGLGGI